MNDQATTSISSNDVTTTTTVTAPNADLATTTTVTVPPPAPPKAGWRTSEFWLKVAALALSTVFASGVLTSSTALAIAGMAATVLTALGYTVSRTMVKIAGVMLLIAMFGLPLTSACSSGAARAVGQVAWDCTAPQRAEAVAVLTPLADSAIRAAASADGKLVDASQLKAALGTANLKTEIGSLLVCAAASAFTALVHATPRADAPAAAALILDPAAAQAAFDQLRAAQFPGVSIKTEHGTI